MTEFFHYKQSYKKNGNAISTILLILILFLQIRLWLYSEIGEIRKQLWTYKITDPCKNFVFAELIQEQLNSAKCTVEKVCQLLLLLFNKNNVKMKVSVIFMQLLHLSGRKCQNTCTICVDNTRFRVMKIVLMGLSLKIELFFFVRLKDLYSLLFIFTIQVGFSDVLVGTRSTQNLNNNTKI